MDEALKREEKFKVNIFNCLQDTVIRETEESFALCSIFHNHFGLLIDIKNTVEISKEARKVLAFFVRDIHGKDFGSSAPQRC